MTEPALCFHSPRIPSGTDGWMEYVPISEKKNVIVTPAQQLKEGKASLYPDMKQNMS